ncbi:acyl--CoA ligase [Sphingomonas sp. CL5.1]|uniref:class I adenylate-forming enzyme family protein n=1 Tax=Sphingomonas sp. CL5.1 TaxID=2653203 RepID=UPI001583A523|nr:class I adenylate-forming enzyme family protein [Sphingomonas sp. CL5.1]QKR98404.1 acyl--CoA ligase [Sphingomonas sp. CL5.1]
MPAGPLMSIDRALRFWARDRPNQRAIQVSRDELDYAALDTWVGTVAASLAGRGVAPQSRVAFYADSSLEWCVAALAAIRCGAIVAPINAKMVAEEVAYLLGRYEPVAIFVDPEGAARLAAGGLIGAPDSPPAITRAEVAALRGAPPRDVAPGIDPEAPAAIITTSGSTARPKGVVYSSRAMIEYAFEETVHNAPDLMGEPQRLLTTAPLSTAGGFNLMIHCVVTGASVHLPAQFDPQEALDTLIRERINTFRASPIFFQRIAALPGFATADLSHVRVCTIGGAPPPPGLLEAWWARGVTLRQLYGQTEAGGGITINPRRYARTDPDRCGHGGPLTEIRIVDEHGRDVPPDTPGQILARKPGMMSGYWRDPDETAKAIIDGWLHTGDIGEVDARGLLRMRDRMKDIIKSGGLNISSAELERVILEAEGVAEVAIIAVPDDRFGETPFAIVHGPSCEPAAILAHCRARLSSYKLPRYIHVAPAPLPRLAMGKISKPALRREWADRPLPAPLR